MNMVTVMTMKTMTMMTKLDKEVGNCEHGNRDDHEDNDDHDDQVEEGGGQPRPSNKDFQGFRIEICYIHVHLTGGRDGGADGEQHQFGEQFLFWGEKR